MPRCASNVLWYGVNSIVYSVWPWLTGQSITDRRPVRKKRPAKRVFGFWFPLRLDVPSGRGLTQLSPHSNIYRPSFIHSLMHAVKRRRAHCQGSVATWHWSWSLTLEIVLMEYKIEKMWGQKARYLLARVMYSESNCGFNFFSLK